jgi:hypothetical protein
MSSASVTRLAKIHQLLSHVYGRICCLFMVTIQIRHRDAIAPDSIACHPVTVTENQPTNERFVFQHRRNVRQNCDVPLVVRDVLEATVPAVVRYFY